ncbi:MAG: transcription antitermination factor NusB [Synergistes sp.]|nr:transcription antitermination factor NusB [Synergistes sp.]MCR5335744.1 transcription antitermination factor NusB [Synergistes sp.]
MNELRPCPAEEALEFFPAEEALGLFGRELAKDGDAAPEKDKFPSVDSFDISLEDAERDEIISYVRELFCGICADYAEVENTVRMHLESKWRSERLNSIDKSIISLAVYEGIIAKKVPQNIAISEAVHLAKLFGAEDSPKFVNGVLGKIARSCDEEHK